MELIWNKYIDEKIDGNVPIRKAYADLYKKNYNWLKDPRGLTIQQWFDEICEILKNEGFNLDETPLSKVENIFVKYDISFEEPLEYTQLLEAKHTFESTLENLKSWEAPPEMIDQAIVSINLLESKIKKLL